MYEFHKLQEILMKAFALIRQDDGLQCLLCITISISDTSISLISQFLIFIQPQYCRSRCTSGTISQSVFNIFDTQCFNDQVNGSKSLLTINHLILTVITFVGHQGTNIIRCRRILLPRVIHILYQCRYLIFLPGIIALIDGNHIGHNILTFQINIGYGHLFQW